MKGDLSRFAPPGLELRQEKQFFLTGLVCAFVYSLLFLIPLRHAWNNLYQNVGERILLPGAVMKDFGALLENSLAGFLVLACCMIGWIVYHYLYHYQGSRSIYLMKRLPKAWELHRRCLTLPLLGVLISFAAAFILLLIYFGIYLALTPEECLVPGQWQRIWRVYL